MLCSFVNTRSAGTDLLVYLNDDDPKLSEYDFLKNCSPILDSHFIVGPKQYITKTYNDFSASGEYDYYSSCNDDHFFVTPEWDRKLIEIVETKGKGWGCAMAADKLTDWTKHPHPSGCVVSGKLIKTLGYMFYPELHHIGNDVLLGKLLKDIGILFEAPEILIEHRHWSNGYRPMDANYKWVYGPEEQNYGEAAMKKYIFEQYEIDKKKILDAMGAEKCAT